MSCVLVYIRQRQWGKCGESRVLIGYPGYRRAHLVRSRSLALIPRRKTIALNGLTRLAIFSQCRRWSRKKAKNKENIKQLLWVYRVRNKRVILDSYYIKVFLLSNKSFSYQAFSVEMIGHYPRFFLFFLRCQCPAILISCMCTASLDQCCCLSNCAPSPSLPWPNNSQLITM